MISNTKVKRAAESRSYSMDFSDFPEIIAGDTIVAIVSVIPQLVSGAGATLPTCSSPGIAANGTGINVTIGGGSPNDTFNIVFLATTALGATLEGVGTLQIAPY